MATADQSEPNNDPLSVMGSSEKSSDKTVLDIYQAILTDAPFEGQLKHLLNLLDESLEVEGGLVFIEEKDKGAFKLLAQAGVSREFAAAVHKLPEDHPLLSAVIQRGGPLVIDAQTAAAPFDVLSPGFADLTFVPLNIHEARDGILVVARRAIPGRNPLDLDLLRLLANQVAVIVENARLRKAAEDLVALNERNRLARELHDSVTQSLYSVTLFAEAGERMLAAGNIEQAATYFARVSETGQQALREMRLLVHRLRPPILAKEGLRAALNQRFRLVEGRTGIEHRLTMADDLTLDPAIEEVAYYIIQEGLNNAIKHARADQVAVTVALNDERHLLVKIEDDGVGFDLQKLEGTAGIGLAGMRERAELHGGRLAINSAPGQGTSITVVLSLEAPEPD